MSKKSIDDIKLLFDKEILIRLLNAFPKSYINSIDEFICLPQINTYFILNSNDPLCQVHNELELQCKVLEWFSRTYKYNETFTRFYKNEDSLYSDYGGEIKTYVNHKKTKYIRDYHLNGINEFLGTEFTNEDLEIIYTKLGNSINRSLTIKFIENNYDMDILR